MGAREVKRVGWPGERGGWSEKEVAAWASKQVEGWTSKQVAAWMTATLGSSCSTACGG